MKIGVLALQGDAEAHAAWFRRVGAETTFVRRPRELAGLDALSLPGGESTTMLHFLAEDGFFEALGEAASRLPIFATCAGLILLAREVRSPAQRSLGLLDVAVERNAFGRQIASFVGGVQIPSISGDPTEGVFIRAPRIVEVGAGVEVLGRLATSGEPVLVRQGRILAASFHPELAADERLGRWFLERVA